MPITRFKDEKEKEEYLKQLKQQQQANLQEANRRNQEATSKFNEIASNSNNNNSTDSNSLWNQIKTTASNNFNNSNNLTFGFDDTIQGNKQASNFLKGLAKDSGYGRNNGFKTSNTANDYMKQALELNKRSQDLQAQEEAKEKDKDSSVLSKVGDFFKNLLSGATQGSANLAQGYADTMAMLEKNLSKDKTSRLDEQIKASPYVNDELNYENKVNANRENTVDKLIGNVGNTIGNMIPSIVVGQATGSAFSDVGGKIGSAISKNASNMAMATQVLGNETANTQLDGQDFNKSYVTGLAKSAVSFATEKLTGGDILSKGTSLDDMAKKYVVNKFKSDWGKRLSTAGLNIAGEVTEENLENQLNYVVDKVINNKDMPDLKNWWNDASETTKTTFFTTALMQLVGLGGSSYKDYVDTDNMNKNDTKNYQKAFDEVKKVVNNTNNTNDANSNNVNYLNSNVNTQTNTQQDIANRLNEIVKNDKYISQEDKQAMIEATNNLASNNQLDNNNTLDAINQIRQISQLSQEHNDQLDTGKKYLSGRKEIYNKYRNVTDYDNSIVQQAKDVIPSNKQGKRTKEQWLDVAKYIGTNIADKSNSEIQKIAYKSWQEETPNNSATLNKQGQKYVKFMSDDWIDTIYDAVEKQRQKSGYVANNDTVNALDNLYNEYTNNQTVQNNNIQNNIDTSKMNLVDSAKAYNLNGNDETIQSINQKLNDRGIASRFDGNLFKNDDGTPNKNINALWRTNTDENGNTRREIVFNPYVDGDINEQKTMQQVTIHEMLHDMAGDKQVRSDLFNLILDKNKKRDGYGDARSNLEEMYSQVYDKNSKDFKDLVDEEEVADTLAQKLGDQDFINSLNEEKPNVFKRIYDWVVDKLNQFTGSKNEKIYWEDVKNKFESAYKREANNEILSKNILRYSLDDKQRNKISKISKNAIDEKGNLKAFKQQLQEYKDKKLPTGVELIVAKDNDGLRYAQVSDKPIVMNQSNINKILINKHSNIDSTILENIDEELQNSVFAMDSRSRKNSKVIVLDKVDNNGNPIIATIYENKKSANIEVNELTSVYEKNKFQNLINSTAKEGYNCYTNKKTNDWLLRNRLQLPTRFAETLVSTNSIPTSNNNVNTTNNNSMQESENNSGSFNLSKTKQKQLELIKKSNPMLDDYHTGVRTVDDIKTFKEAYDIAKKEASDGGWDEYASYPDITNEMIEDSLKTGKITVYSSNDIKNGAFVTPSYEQALEYAGNDSSKVKSKKVNVDEVAWINLDEGQYAKVDNSNIKPSIEQSGAWQSFLENQIGQTGKGKTVQELRLPTKENLEIVQNSNKSLQNKKKLNPVEISKLKPEDALTTPNLKSKKYEKGNKQSSFLSNIVTDSEFLNKDLRQEIGNEESVKYYKGITNKETLEKSYKELQDGGSKEVLNWFSKDDKNITADDVTKGWILLKQYQDAGDYASAVEVAKKMRNMGTKAGQTVQAFNILSRLTPEGMTLYAQKELSEAYDQMVKGKSKKWIEENESKFDLSPNETAFIKDTMEQVSKMEDGYDKKVKLAEIQKLITDKIPPAKGQGVKAWMRISMLFNPKTQVRNVAGNAVILPVNMFSDSVSAGVDRLISKKTGVRTTGNINIKNYVKGFGKGLSESYNDFKKGINTRNIEENRFEVGEGKSFKDKGIGKALNRVDGILSFMLDAGDRGFYEATFNNSINNQKVLNGTNDVTQDMIDIATTEALQRTWQDSNTYTNSVLGIRNLLNKVNANGYGLGDVLIPFAKTPANLTKAIIDYSPIGLTKTLTLDAKKFKNAIDTDQYVPQMQHKFVQDIGKGFAGTFLYVAGYALAKAGILSGEADDDKDVKNFMKNSLGISSYSIKIGNKSFTYDWAQPVATPFAIMSNFVKYDKENPDASILEKGIKALNIGTEQLLEQSFMESLNTVLNGNGEILENLAQSVFELPARAIPTFSKQIADMVDSTQRTTFEYDKPIQSAINSVIAKIPIASKSLAPSIDTLGNEIQKYGGENNFFNVFMNPANTNKGKLTKAGTKIYDLYMKTGDSKVFPVTAPYYINNNGDKIVMDSKQRAEYQKTTGDYTEKAIDELIKNKDYKKLSDDKKVELISNIINDSNNMAKHKVLNIESKDAEKTRKLIEKVGTKAYYDYSFKTQNIEGENANKQKMNILEESDYSNSIKSELYSNTIGQNDDNYNTIYKNAGININEYLKYKQQDFTSDKKDDGTLQGKSTKNKKNKVFNYVNNMKLSYENRLILLGTQYKLNTQERKDLFNYINTIKINKDDKLKFLNKCQGFTVYKDGTVEY